MEVKQYLHVRQAAVQRSRYGRNDPDVDPVGACVGMNGARVNADRRMSCAEKRLTSLTWE